MNASLSEEIVRNEVIPLAKQVISFKLAKNGDPTIDPDDLVQEALQNILKKESYFLGLREDNFEKYKSQLICFLHWRFDDLLRKHNQKSDILKQSKSYETEDELTQDLEMGAQGPQDEALIHRQQKQLLAHLIKTELNEKEQKVLMGLYYGPAEKSTYEIAERMKVTDRTVRNLHHRALEKLEKAWQKLNKNIGNSPSPFQTNFAC